MVIAEQIINIQDAEACVRTYPRSMHYSSARYDNSININIRYYKL
jgi:hypothetical protein